MQIYFTSDYYSTLVYQLTASSLITAITTSATYSIASDRGGNTLTIVTAELARRARWSCMGNHTRLIIDVLAWKCPEISLTASSLVTAITTSTTYSIAPERGGNALTIVTAKLARRTPSCMGKYYSIHNSHLYQSSLTNIQGQGTIIYNDNESSLRIYVSRLSLVQPWLSTLHTIPQKLIKFFGFTGLSLTAHHAIATLAQ